VTIPRITILVSLLVLHFQLPGQSQVIFEIVELRKTILKAPLEFSTLAEEHPVELELPWPGGNRKSFLIVESPILEPGLVNKYADYKSYQIEAVNDPGTNGRLTLTPFGLNGLILSPEGMFIIRPLDPQNPIFHEIVLEHKKHKE
jgi:hypothetical protein